MGISSETTFGIKRSLPFNAEAIFNRNRILIGLETFTLEVLIHEINELETSNLLKRWGYNHNALFRHRGMRAMKARRKELKSYYWTGTVDLISHLISPYGGHSLISPSNSPSNEQYLYTRP